MEINLTNRVHIDAPAGVIDIEGEKDFVEGLLAKLFPLIENAGFGSSPVNTLLEPSSEMEPASDQSAPVENGKSKAGTRKASKRTPAGHSCADRILTLKADGFFKEHRGSGDIVTGLKGKGWTHKSNLVGAALTQLFERGQIQRTKEGNGPWKYYWDRD